MRVNSLTRQQRMAAALTAQTLDGAYVFSDEEIFALDEEGVCAICGCTDSRACPGGCHWIEDPAGLMRDICSACEDEAAKGDSDVTA